MQQKIPIENLYYLLCYAWGVSDQLDKVKVDGEKCHSLENLLSTVLLNACDRLLRQGLLRAYRFEEQEVEGVRGKLNLAETLKSGKHLNGRTICQVDELTQDVVINRVIFSTLKRLMRISEPGCERLWQNFLILRRFGLQKVCWGGFVSIGLAGFISWFLISAG